MRIKQIGSIVLTNPMWAEESTTTSLIEGEITPTLNGGAVTVERLKPVSMRTMTLQTRDYGWQKRAVVSALIALSNSSVGAEVTVKTTENETFHCRFRYEVSNGECVKFEERYEGASIFKGAIYLAYTR